MRPPLRLRDGFSLVETLIVLGVVLLLIVTAGPLRTGRISSGKVVSPDALRSVLLAELSYFGKHDNFTKDRGQLLAIDPGLPLGEAGRSGSIYIVVGRSRALPAVCLFAESRDGGWNTLYYSGRRSATLRLGSPNDCIRVMLDEQQGLDPARGREWTAEPGATVSMLPATEPGTGSGTAGL